MLKSHNRSIFHSLEVVLFVYFRTKYIIFKYWRLNIPFIPNNWELTCSSNKIKMTMVNLDAFRANMVKTM